MAYIEQRYQDLENGRATPEQALPMIRAANKQIEERMLPDDLQIATLDWLDGDDRYRLKHFTARLS